MTQQKELYRLQKEARSAASGIYVQAGVAVVAAGELDHHQDGAAIVAPRRCGAGRSSVQRCGGGT